MKEHHHISKHEGDPGSLEQDPSYLTAKSLLQDLDREWLPRFELAVLSMQGTLASGRSQTIETLWPKFQVEIVRFTNNLSSLRDIPSELAERYPTETKGLTDQITEVLRQYSLANQALINTSPNNHPADIEIWSTLVANLKKKRTMILEFKTKRNPKSL